MTRQKLEVYAAVLGRNSTAAKALAKYDDLKAAGLNPKIQPVLSGWVIKTATEQHRYA